ncbi:MAG: 2,3-bisphosphoglycerate-independent phosphoglycerate mutase, partial [Lishizhenia sp.]
MSKKVGLIILDGWGIGDKSKSDAIFNAKTPCMDNLIANYPNATLVTHGEEVGLPQGQMGNSEVGHLNIGAGRIVYQELTRINKAIKDKTFFENKALTKAFSEAKQKNKKVHFIGLVSEGGVHSSQQHLYALCEMAKSYDLKDVFIHAFTDGRDCDPKSGKQFLLELQDKIKASNIEIASIIGRYFAMDRDNRWERIKKAYDLLVHAKGNLCSDLEEVFDTSYANEITDEFIEPTLLTAKNAKIEEGDTVICFNFRTDRTREISIALTQKEFPEFGIKPVHIDYYTMTSYDDAFQNVNVVFSKDNLQNTLGEVLSKHNKTQIRIAETEKYPHVTFFFSGGREKEFANEKRILVN